VTFDPTQKQGSQTNAKTLTVVYVSETDRQTDRQTVGDNAKCGLLGMGYITMLQLFIHKFLQLDCARRAQTLPRRMTSTKVIRYSNPDLRINLDSDPDVCQTARKMLWIRYLVGIGHFAKFRESRPVTA